MTAVPEEDGQWWEILASTLRPVPVRDARDGAPALDIGAGPCPEIWVDCPREHWLTNGYRYHALRE